MWDPFCGSGVVPVAAGRLGATVIASDINPIACVLTRVASGRYDIELLRTEGERIIQTLQAEMRPAYEVVTGSVKYFVHGRLGNCHLCCHLTAPRSAESPRTCSKCGGHLDFRKLNGSIDTSLLGAEIRDRGMIRPLDPTWPEILDHWKRLDKTGEALYNDGYDQDLVENNRTLTPQGARVSRYFTKFAFAALSRFAHLIELSDDRVKDPLRLVLTSAATQCSRLIPYRNNMTTGGPAWTIPGFWVAPVHLECNVFDSLRTRLRKVAKGIAQATSSNPDRNGISVFQVPVSEEDSLPSFEADLIFMDPPYAGDVPYLEFSALWNAFLGSKDIDFAKETVVSDRVAPRSTIIEYRAQISEAVHAVERRLSADGHLILTFNNLDFRTWSAIFCPLQDLGFRVRAVHYQEPAVKSSKSQFAPKTSYVGDFYIVLHRAKKCRVESARTTEAIRESIEQLFFLRGTDVQPVNRVRTVALQAVLKTNGSYDLFEKIDDIIGSACDLNNGTFALRNPQNNQESYETYVQSLLEKARSHSRPDATDSDLIAAAIAADEGRTLPERREIGLALNRLPKGSEQLLWPTLQPPSLAAASRSIR